MKKQRTMPRTTLAFLASRLCLPFLLSRAVAVAVAESSGQSAQATSFCDPSTGWGTVWRDEFDGDGLNVSQWTKTLGNDGTEAEHVAGGSRSQLRDAWGTAANVYVSNGSLVLRSDRARVTGPDGTVYNVTSGAVTTRHLATWAHGRICVRARLPGTGKGGGKDAGIWPAHWLMPSDSSCWPDHGEIDITEMINGDGITHGTYHWNRFWPNQTCTKSWNTSAGHPGDTALGGWTNLTQLTAGGWPTAWHEYAVEWDGRNRMAFVVDGATILNITRANQTRFPSKVPGQHPQFSGAPFYLILNTALGGPWPGPVGDETVFPAFHHIDYVRVAQRRPRL